GWNVAGNGEISAKVYVAPRRGAEHRSVAYLADRAGIDSREVLAALRAAALERALWRNDVVLCTGSEPAPGLLAVHAAPPPDADRLELARAVLDRYAGGATVLDDMVVRTATTGLAWLVSGIGISFAPPGEVEHVNVYLAPS
ncbi:MAG: hypothetical protein J2P57_19460, partial [Acidimicrobiaceae bacterium]|nr:hypothetical protein [Acidimicrobiaceae bacterium]